MLGAQTGLYDRIRCAGTQAGGHEDIGIDYDQHKVNGIRNATTWLSPAGVAALHPYAEDLPKLEASVRAIIADTGDPRVTVKIEGGWSRPLFRESASKAMFALAEQGGPYIAATLEKKPMPGEALPSDCCHHPSNHVVNFPASAPPAPARAAAATRLRSPPAPRQPHRLYLPTADRQVSRHEL